MNIARTAAGSFVRHVLLATLLVGLGACAQFKPAREESAAKAGMPTPARGIVSLLYYFEYARTLPAAELAKETERVRQLEAAEKSDFRTVQYALLLSVPGGDARRAQQLLEPLVRETAGRNPELRALADLLYADLAERRRLEDGARKADDLEKKLEALKNIEKSLIQRDTSDPGDKK